MGHGKEPLLGQYDDGGMVSYDLTGSNNVVYTGYDLHDIPERITTWYNVYSSGLLLNYSSREEADIHAGYDRIYVYRIERNEDGSNPEIFAEDV